MSQTRTPDGGQREGNVDMNVSDTLAFHGSKSSKLHSHCFEMIAQQSPSHIEFPSFHLFSGSLNSSANKELTPLHQCSTEANTELS